MRHWTLLLTSLLLLAIPTHVAAQDEEEAGPGDNFDLTGALDAFSKAKSLEEFEKKINDPDSQINNLDLNEDDQVDYVRVVEKVEEQTHVFILRVPVAKDEEQDIATIEIEKTGKEDVTAQIVGDEEIYGPDYIIEPDTSETAFRKSWGNPVLVASAGDDWSGFLDHELAGDPLDDPTQLALVVVFRWPIVPIIFAVGYSPWVSPWYWGAWPPWWSVWRPVAWGVWGARRVAWSRAAWRHTAVRRSHRARSIHRAHHRSSSRAQHHRAGGSRPGDRPGKDRPGGDRPGGDRPGGDRPGGDRPGGDRPGADRPGGDRPGGDRPSTADRQAGSGRDRQGSGASTGSRDRASAGSRDRSAGSSRSREATSRSSGGQSTRSRGNSSFGGYGSSGSARSHSSRGSMSRGGGGRGGGRGGGGRRR